MPERPLIIFPRQEESEKARRSGGAQKMAKPPVNRQFERLEPKFAQLQSAFETKRISVIESVAGIEPELALVFETAGSVDSFYTAIKNYPKIEWMFDVSIDQMASDDNFYLVDKEGERKEGDITGKIYCVMTSRAALEDLVSMWKQYKDHEDFVFQHGLTGLRDIFINLRDIRRWEAKDRIEETGVMEYWVDSLEKETDEVNFEIELFFRASGERRTIVSGNIRQDIDSMDGHVIGECVIDQIHYHCILAALPRNKVQALVDNYEDIELVRIDDIMFFRPVGQIAVEVQGETEEFDLETGEEEQSEEPPIVAILDGYPMENHLLLSNKLIIDDPEGWVQDYLVRHRVHGTAMASLVLYGDYNANNISLNRRIYVRPIFKPIEGINGYYEQVPDNEILVDLIHRSVKRMFEGEGEGPATAPSIKVINLCLGDPARQFVNMMSPLARLIDWLSSKYKVLFIISAGNHNLDGIDCGMEFSDFKVLPEDDKEKLVLNYIASNSQRMRLLSPAESINSLTVGALFADTSDAQETENTTLPYVKPLPSPISAVGYGYNKSIKPDIFVNGGRNFLKPQIQPGSTQLKWVGQDGSISRPPGALLAVPGQEAERSNKAYFSGTSVSAAQVSHESAKCFNVLEDIFSSQISSQVPDENASVLIKAMLTHSAVWGVDARFIANNMGPLGSDVNRLAKWLGNGIPNFPKVHECGENRITLIGYGSLLEDKAHSYFLPIPIDFSQARIYRSMAVTLAYFSPIISTRQKYRSANLWFTLENNALFENRTNTDMHVVRRGTLQHEIFSGNRARNWDINDLVEIKVNCAEDADSISEPIPYAILVTLEIVPSIDVDIYQAVLIKIREMIPVAARAT